MSQTYFSKHAARWRQLYNKAGCANDLVLQARMAIVLEYVRMLIPSGASILDAGCGAGVIACALAKDGYGLTCADSAPEMIAQARLHFAAQGAAQPLFYSGDVAAMDNGMFDGIIAVGFMEYQEDEAGMLGALATKLRPGGVLICTGPGDLPLGEVLGLRALHGLYLRARRISRQMHPSRNRYNTGRFMSLLEPLGLTVTHSRYHGFAGFPFIDGLLPLSGQLAFSLALERLSQILPMTRFANDLVIAARKDGHA